MIHVPLDDIPRVIAVLQELETRAYQQMQVDYDTRNGSADGDASVAATAGAVDDSF